MANDVKLLLCSVSCLLLFSCALKRGSISNPVVTLTAECPKAAECSLLVTKNKSLNVKKDEWGNVYYVLEDNPGKNVIKYTYSAIVKGNLQDAGYREEIVFEYDASLRSLSGVDLQNIKMLFGRFCFCRGQTGYYPVTKGELLITSGTKEKTATLNFTIDEVPQIIKNITFSIK